jgi:hypothetical protein
MGSATGEVRRPRASRIVTHRNGYCKNSAWIRSKSGSVYERRWIATNECGRRISLRITCYGLRSWRNFHIRRSRNNVLQPKCRAGPVEWNSRQHLQNMGFTTKSQIERTPEPRDAAHGHGTICPRMGRECELRSGRLWVVRSLLNFAQLATISRQQPDYHPVVNNGESCNERNRTCLPLFGYRFVLSSLLP